MWICWDVLLFSVFTWLCLLLIMLCCTEQWASCLLVVGGLSSELLYSKLECRWFVFRTAVQQTGMSALFLRWLCATEKMLKSKNKAATYCCVFLFQLLQAYREWNELESLWRWLLENLSLVTCSETIFVVNIVCLFVCILLFVCLFVSCFLSSPRQPGHFHPNISSCGLRIVCPRIHTACLPALPWELDLPGRLLVYMCVWYVRFVCLSVWW